MALPKLIDQIKESESTKSFIKMNNISVNELDQNNNSLIMINESSI